MLCWKKYVLLFWKLMLMYSLWKGLERISSKDLSVELYKSLMDWSPYFGFLCLSMKKLPYFLGIHVLECLVSENHFAISVVIWLLINFFSRVAANFDEMAAGINKRRVIQHTVFQELCKVRTKCFYLVNHAANFNLIFMAEVFVTKDISYQRCAI